MAAVDLSTDVAATRDTFVDLVTESGVIPLPTAQRMFDSVFMYGRAVGVYGTLRAIADHGPDVGAELVMASMDAEDEVLGR
jgi:hypothetical protein